jgi:ubiquinone/menaquinone biosynthesis C-methylase UbiE
MEVSMKRARVISRLVESELKFWKNVYKSDEAHWLDKSPSNLAKKVVKKYAPLGLVLEVGCAAGIDTFFLATSCDKIIGIDLVPQVVATAKENLTNQDETIKKRVSLEVGDVENLRFKDESFDLVYSLSVFHSTEIQKSLSETFRVLRKGGKAVIYVYVGKKKEEIDKDYFIKTCEGKFTIIDQSEFKIDQDAGNDSHTALIVWLEKSKN